MSNRYIVNLCPCACYLTSGDGSSSRTMLIDSAMRFKTEGSARRALNASLKHRAWPDAKILTVSVTVIVTVVETACV